ncbi:hydroxyneurosporene synthase [Fusarium tjaetaba]|uniref:Hydroxyneurosporene synthase n=1 Tax=Fusarium tjaetaba TaxID=1567544 RepID=A0A8H5S922_9HYPO|nr:hydroxyneurosporene synthase [Fusarium tjaetaba]KAF5649075.1 hydroxyneurosporene synthase [Fusarium tjaetaba]
MPATPMPWDPPEHDPTTIDNDGTFVTRYDARKTLAYVTEDTNNVNNVFMLYWITTKCGKKYHLTSNAGLRGSQLLGTFISLNDLQDLTSRGASILHPGSGNPKRLELKSATQNITSPEDGDQWTNTHLDLDFVGIKLDVTLRPTGGNFYYGGGGGIQLVNRGPDPDGSTSLPGWSWYWANPTTRLTGKLVIDENEMEIDTKQSYALFERQWGNFHIGKGYYALWFYLETGEVLISWCMEPTPDGVSKIAFASVWHPNGRHEMLPVGPKSRASDISVSHRTGLKYFNSFFLDLPCRNAHFTFEKWVRDGELIPALEEQRDKYITISESYGEGTGMWDEKQVLIQGHVEQLSMMR